MFTSSVTLFLIIVTVITTLLAWSFASFQNDGMLRPYYIIRENRWYQLLSSGFLHADMIHLIFNMYTLWAFGPTLERQIGSGMFLALYFTSMIVANLPSLIRHRNDPNYSSLGASGAVGGVIFSFIVFFPQSSLLLFLIPIPINAVVFAILFIAFSIYESKRKRSFINHDAHIAGALSGVIFTFIAFPGSGLRLLDFIGSLI